MSCRVTNLKFTVIPFLLLATIAGLIACNNPFNPPPPQPATQAPAAATIATAATPEPTPAPSPTIAPTAVPTPDVPNTDIDDSGCPKEVAINTQFDCVVTVTNTSRSWVAVDFTLNVGLPDGVRLVSEASNPVVPQTGNSPSLSWEVGDFPPGSAFEVRLQLESEKARYEIAIETDLLWEDIRGYVLRGVGQGTGLAHTFVGEEEPAVVNEEFDYVLTLRQQGPRAVIGIDAAIELPPELEFVSVEGAGYTLDSNIVRFDTLGLLVDEIKELRVRVKAIESADILVKALVRRDGFLDREPVTLFEGTQILE